MRFLRSLMNLGLAAIGAILGNLLAAWVVQDAWGNAITPARLLASAAGFALVILILAWLDARAERRSAATTTGEVKGNVQIGHSVIRVLGGANVLGNIQIGNNVIEVGQSPQSIAWPEPSPSHPPPDQRTNRAPIQQRDSRQQQMELEARYEDLTRRIAAVDSDLRQALDGEQKLALQERRASLVAQRQQVVSELERIESGLPT